MADFVLKTFIIFHIGHFFFSPNRSQFELLAIIVELLANYIIFSTLNIQHSYSLRTPFYHLDGRFLFPPLFYIKKTK